MCADVMQENQDQLTLSFKDQRRASVSAKEFCWGINNITQVMSHITSRTEQQ